MARRRPTQADVARLAGVSPSVVSAVLNTSGANNVRVGRLTAARVWDAVRDLGYVPNIAARNLARGRNGIVGVFTYEAVFPLSNADFYHGILEGIEQEAERAGLHLLLFTALDQDGRRSIYNGGLNSLQMADGAILIGLNEDKAELGQLAADDFPFVFVGRREVPGHEVSYVAADYVTAGRQVVELLLDRGHRRLAFVRGGWYREPTMDREVGFRLATEDPGAPVELARLVRVTDDDHDVDLVRTLRRLGVTAVVADDCAWATRVGAAAADLGLRVPQDLSVVAVCDMHRGAARHLDVSTVVTPRVRMGVEAVRLLASMLDGEAGARHVTVPCDLHSGGTVAVAPTEFREVS